MAVEIQRRGEVLAPGFEALEVLLVELGGGGLRPGAVVRHAGIGQEEVVDCYLYNEQYHKSMNTYIAPQYIQEVGWYSIHEACFGIFERIDPFFKVCKGCDTPNVMHTSVNVIKCSYSASRGGEDAICE